MSPPREHVIALLRSPSTPAVLFVCSPPEPLRSTRQIQHGKLQTVTGETSHGYKFGTCNPNHFLTLHPSYKLIAMCVRHFQTTDCASATKASASALAQFLTLGRRVTADQHRSHPPDDYWRPARIRHIPTRLMIGPSVGAFPWAAKGGWSITILMRT